MAYCRFSETCDVYMYNSIMGGFMFHLGGKKERVDPEAKSDFLIRDPEKALRKLKRLQTQGFGVPNYAIERLEDEIKKGIHSN